MLKDTVHANCVLYLTNVEIAEMACHPWLKKHSFLQAVINCSQNLGYIVMGYTRCYTYNCFYNGFHDATPDGSYCRVQWTVTQPV